MSRKKEMLCDNCEEMEKQKYCKVAFPGAVMTTPAPFCPVRKLLWILRQNGILSDEKAFRDRQK